jgi:colicin import membrane protein
MNAASASSKKPVIFSLLLHGIILALLIGFESNQTIFITPEVNDAPIIEASLILTRPIQRPVPKLEVKPEVKSPEVKKPELKAQPEPEPEIQTKNIVVIKAEEKKPLVDKNREKELKKTAEKSLEQAFKQEKLQEELQQDFQKKLQEHEAELRQSSAVSQSEVNQFMRAIAAKVTKNWRQPIDTKIKGLACVVLIKTVSNGTIIDVQVIQSSGNVAFDRSTEIAVKKSSPLPIPQSEMARAQFKLFEFSFHPPEA